MGAESPVTFLVATRRWPVRCAAGLVLLWGAVPRKGRHLVSSGGLLPAGTGLDTSREQRVERLSHDRTTVRHRQRLGSHRKFVLRSQHTRGSPRHVPLGSCCAIIVSPFTSWSDREGAHSPVGSTALWTAHAVRLIRPQGSRPRVAAWSPRSHAAGCCWPSDTQWAASSTAGRLRHLEDSGTGPGSTTRSARSHKRAVTPFLWPECVAVLTANVLFRCTTFSAYVTCLRVEWQRTREGGDTMEVAGNKNPRIEELSTSRNLRNRLGIRP